MVKKIKFRISPEGTVTLDVTGTQGSECEAMTAPFEQALGPVAQREHKDSYFQTQSSEDSVTTQREYE